MFPCDNSMLTSDWTERSRPLTTDSEHVLSGLVDLDEDSVVDLPQSEKLQDLLDLGGDLVDTTDSHDEDQLRLGGDIVVALLLGIALQPGERKCGQKRKKNKLNTRIERSACSVFNDGALNEFNLQGKDTLNIRH